MFVWLKMFWGFSIVGFVLFCVCVLSVLVIKLFYLLLVKVLDEDYYKKGEYNFEYDYEVFFGWVLFLEWSKLFVDEVMEKFL